MSPSFSDTSRAAGAERIETWRVLGLVLPVAAILRIGGLPGQRLTYDEIFPATFVAQSALTTLVAALRFDLHPPLYYLFLRVWACFGQSDAWLLLNTTAWSLAGVGALYAGARRFLGPSVAMAAAAVLAVLPVDASIAHQLRMYSMTSGLVVLAWAAARQALAADRPLRWLSVTVALQILLVYSYALGLAIALCVALYGVLKAFEQSSRRVLSGWIASQAVLLLISLPAAANALLRSAEHATSPGLSGVLETFAQLTLGRAASGGVVTSVVGAALLVTIVASALATRKLRPEAIAFLVAPFALAFLVSRAARPMWHLRVFFFTTPFVALAAGDALVRLSSRFSGRSRYAAYAGIAVVLGALFAISATTTWRWEKPYDYRSVAQVIRSQHATGDVVWVPERVGFWGVARYLVGPRWGSPLEVQEPEPTERWARALSRLPPAWRRSLHLEGEHPDLITGDLTLCLGARPPDVVRSAHRVWVMDEDGTTLRDDVTLAEQSRSFHRGLVLRLLERSSP